jgi:hypothetical protein
MVDLLDNVNGKLALGQQLLQPGVLAFFMLGVGRTP